MNQKGKRTLTPKLRFPEFRDKPGWEEKPLEAVCSPVERKKPKPDSHYIGLGIRSHSKGTFLKPDMAVRCQEGKRVPAPFLRVSFFVC
jgi:type I restriction enzyme S subunit